MRPARSTSRFGWCQACAPRKVPATSRRSWGSGNHLALCARHSTRAGDNLTGRLAEDPSLTAAVMLRKIR